MKNARGSTVVEFTLILPIVILAIIASVALSLTGVRGIVAQLAAIRAARVATVFQDEFIDYELYAALSPAIYRGSIFDIEGARLVSNELPGRLAISAVPNSLLDFEGFGMNLIKRDAPIVPALPTNLSNATLRGGDSPSPYCRKGGGYSVCGLEN